MSQVRRYAAAGLDEAARRSRRRRMAVGALDETGQEKQGVRTAGVKRQYMGCAGPGRERDQHGAPVLRAGEDRPRAGRGAAVDPGRGHQGPGEVAWSRACRWTCGSALRAQLAIDVLADAYGDGLSFDFACGDEVYGSCTALREFLEDRGQAYVLRVASSFTLALAAGTTMTCADAVKKLLKGKQGWEVRSAGKGSKGERWYAWAWLATASPRHSLLVRRHLKTGELAFHYCFVPDGQLASKARLIRAAGLRWPVGGELRARERAASAWTSARPGSTPRSCGTSCWSWPPSRSAPSPPPSSGTAPTPRPRRPPARTPRRPLTPV